MLQLLRTKQIHVESFTETGDNIHEFCLTFQSVTSCFDIWHRDHLVHSKKVQEVIEKLYLALDDLVLANKVIDNYYNESSPQSPSQL